MKRLYTVAVSFEFAVLAENEREACDHANEAARDALYDAHVTASLTVRDNGKGPVVSPPDGYDDDTLVYGTDEDVTFAEAVEADRQLVTLLAREAEFAKKQGDLFGKKS